MADIHITCGSHGVRLVSQMAAVVLMCTWKEGAHVVLKLKEVPRGCLYVLWLVREKLSRDT